MNDYDILQQQYNNHWFKPLRRAVKNYYKAYSERIRFYKDTFPVYCPDCHVFRRRVYHDEIVYEQDLGSYLYCDDCRQRKCRKQAAALISDREFVTYKNDRLIIDTETTGLREDDEIVEIAIIDALTQSVEINTLVKPTKATISERARAVHGITPEMVQHAPSWSELWPQISDIIKDKSLSSYNWEFDSRMINASCDAAGIQRGTNVLGNGNNHCIMKLVAEYVGRWNYRHNGWSYIKLQEAAGIFNIDTGGVSMHRALGDAITASNVLLKLAGTSYEEIQREFFIEVPF